MRVLRTLAAEDRRDLVTLGMTPVVTAQLDDPYCLTGMHHWLANWQLRAREAAPRSGTGDGTGYSSPEAMRAFGIREYDEADRALEDFASPWRHGGSPLLRSADRRGHHRTARRPAGAPVPAAAQPPAARVRAARGPRRRAGRASLTPRRGIWAPECAYAPGMEDGYAAAGVSHFMVDGPSLHGDTALGRPVGDSDVVAFGRDLQVSYRVWSPKSGYPGHAAYRDFHTYDHLTGLKPARVTGRNVPSEEKAPYDPERADAAVDSHVADFVEVVRERLLAESERIGRPAHVVAAFDTELFGHWWYEGPVWLERVLRALPEAGVRVGTLSDAIADGFVGAPVELPPSSWGSGKDWQVWSGEQVADLVALNAEVVDTALATVDKAMAHTRSRRRPRRRRRPDPARDAADGLQRLAVHGQQGHRRRLRALPRASARARHPRDRRRAGVGPPRAASDWPRLEPRRRPVRALDAPTALTLPASVHVCATRRARFAHARAASTDEGPDGVVGVPAGGHRRARPARPPPGHRAGRRGPRGGRAEPPPVRHRPEHATRRPTR